MVSAFDENDWTPEMELDLLGVDSFMEDIDSKVAEFAKYLASMPNAQGRT